MINNTINILEEGFNVLDYSTSINKRVHEVLPKEIAIASSDDELKNITNFRKTICTNDSIGASMFINDGFDSRSYVLSSKDEQGEIIATARFLPDSDLGFPEGALIPNHIENIRKQGKKIAEAGRFTIVKNKKSLLRMYYRAIYDIAMQTDTDVVIMIIKNKSVSSYQRMMAIDVLSENMGVSWDEEQDDLSLVAWNINAHQPKFEKWTSKKELYSKTSWDNYSNAHLSVFTSIQKEVYEQIAINAYHNVLDAGCGSGRVMAYLQDNSNVTHYTGVDMSTDMIKQASWLKNELQFDTSRLVNSKIEEISGSFDYIFSVHSYYTWPDKKAVLSHIYNLLESNGKFVLVTPNNSFNTEKLSRLVKQETLGHPYYNEFLNINYEIANQAKNENLYTHIDDLIDVVRGVGFKVNTAHNEFFLVERVI